MKPIQGITQLEFTIEKPVEQDRNFHLGGRSFYFFDFDDNVAFLSTPLLLFHKETGLELAINSQQFAICQSAIGQAGPYQNYEIRWEDRSGTFRNFRDHHPDQLRRLGLKNQVFIQDVAEALGLADFHWKGPSWSCFYHATFNQRPTSIITARGHEPETLKSGIELFVKQGHLPKSPNFLSLFPVSHPETRKLLGDLQLNKSVPELKRAAIRASVEQAIEKYGMNPHHRFGMSDDDPKNLELILEEMRFLKSRYPKMSFFVIETHNGQFIKHEVFPNGIVDEDVTDQQASLF